MFRQAQRSSANLRLALCGPSGSGKTYSALKIATGLGGRIALIDTERGSSELYSHVCDFDVAQLEPPFSPERYVQAIDAADNAGYDVLVIDSLSHAWSGPGGVLEMQDQAAKALRNSFAAWREVTPEHNRLVDALLDTSCQLIVTMRTKTAYEVQQENGKNQVKKVGLAPIQRDGLEYEFTVVLDLAVDGHVASSSKDRTGLFDGRRFVPDENTGQVLQQWLVGGDHAQGKSQTSLGTGFLLEQIERALVSLGLRDLHDAYESYVCEKYGVGGMQMLTHEQLTEQLVILRQCQERRSRKEQFVELLRGKVAA